MESTEVQIQEKIPQLKNAIINTSSSPFGGIYMQHLLYEILDDSKSKNNAYDALRNGSLHGEYKAIRLINTQKQKYHNMLDEIISPKNKKLMNFEDIKNGNITANCQNIKPDEFDYLDYVIVCNDGFYLFEISVQDFNHYTSLPKNDKNKFPNWCFKHGRKEKQQNGQFVISKSNIKWHLDHTFKQKITWENAYKIWESLPLTTNKIKLKK